jgi:ribose transport system permease protein
VTTPTSTDTPTPGAAPGPALGRRPVGLGLLRRNAPPWRALAILIPFLALFTALSVASGPFFTQTNLLNILDQQSATLIIGAAGTLVLISGGIDLSVGATYALAGVVAAMIAQHHGVAAGVVVGIALGTLIGLINGVISTIFRINSLIATLAMSFVISGVGSRISNGNLIVLTGQPSYAKVAQTVFLSVRTSIWTALVVVVILTLLLTGTTHGRYIYAAGGNAEAARLAGIRVNAVQILTFTLSGTAAAVGGVIDTSRVLTAQASSGTTLTFTVLAGIVVGGTSIMGGEGAVWRTVVGVLFIALVGNGFDLLGLNSLYEQIALGVILLLAVGIDAWSRLRRR